MTAELFAAEREVRAIWDDMPASDRALLDEANVAYVFTRAVWHLYGIPAAIEVLATHARRITLRYGDDWPERAGLVPVDGECRACHEPTGTDRDVDACRWCE